MTPAEEKPEIKISLQESVDSKDLTNKSQNRLRKGSDRSEYDDDFYDFYDDTSPAYLYLYLIFVSYICILHPISYCITSFYCMKKCNLR